MKKRLAARYGARFANGEATASDDSASEPEKLRVLYFTVIPLGTTGNGGSICSRNHVARMAADPGIELISVVAGLPEAKPATDAFFAGLDVNYYFQPLRHNTFHHSANSLRSIASFAARAVFQFYGELKALNQPHIQECIDSVIKRFSIDVLVIEYHPSALFLTLPRYDVVTIMIKQNREGDFYEDLIKLGKTHHGSLTAPISLWRARRFERTTDANVDKVIVIGPPDLPARRLRTPPVCISPYLDPKPVRWTYSNSKSLLFVGAISHYPNEMAVKWIATRLAPALQEENSTAQIVIVGATTGEISPDWQGQNVKFVGRSSDEELRTLFLTSDLMLCPIENDFGVKFKSLEALSYGIPLLASKQTLLGLPYLRDTPSIDLEDEQGAAKTICALLDNCLLLQSLSDSQGARQRSFIVGQQAIWSRTFAKIPSQKRSRLR